MFVIYCAGFSRCVISYWDHITEVGERDCTTSYWMVPGTVEA